MFRIFPDLICRKCSQGYLDSREHARSLFASDTMQVSEDLDSSRRVTLTPDCDTLEKYHRTPPIPIVILMPKYTLLLAGSSVCTTHVYHDAAPIHITMLCGGNRSGLLEHPQPS